MKNRIKGRKIIQFMVKNTEIVDQSEHGTKEGLLFRLHIWPYML